MRKGVEEGRGIGVVPHEDREVAEPSLTANGLARDEIRYALGLLDSGHLLDVIHVDLVR